jgi:hypothetical protein
MIHFGESLTPHKNVFNTFCAGFCLEDTFLEQEVNYDERIYSLFLSVGKILLKS